MIFFQIFNFSTENVTFKKWGENLRNCFLIFNFSNSKNCSTLSSHISGLQALPENKLDIYAIHSGI